jgi:hypothetical protein
MIDVLLCFPSRDIAGQIGVALGYSKVDAEKGFVTTQATLSLAVCVIGEHFVGEEGDGKYWVMVRSLADINIPEQIKSFIVEPDENNPAIPKNRWA